MTFDHSSFVNWNSSFTSKNMISQLAILTLLAAMDPLRMRFAVPIIVSVSLVYAATRHEEMGPIMVHAARFAVWIVVFMAIVFAVLQALSWLQ